jgi:MscS family membrane protein
MSLAHTNRVLLAGFLFVSWAAGQQPASPPAASPPESQPVEQAPQDPLGRSTPYGTVVGFMRALGAADFARSAEYLDNKGTDSEKKQLVEQLGRVLDRAMTLQIDSLSRQPSGSVEEGVRKARERVGIAAAGSKSLDILLELVERQGQPPIWLFSTQTLAGVPDFAEHLEGPWQEKYLPTLLVEKEFLSIQLYRWIAAPVILALIYFVTKAFAWLLTLLLKPVVLRLSGHHDDRTIAVSSTGPLGLLFFSLVAHASTGLGVTALARHFWGMVSAILIAFSVAWLLVRLIRIATNMAAARMRRLKTPEKIALANLTGRLMQISVGLLAMLVVLRIVGVDLTGILAGLGIGGIALALGAQKTLENFLGGVMIIWDAPVRVGDLCRAGQYLGTIEDIGLRSTRIRTLDRSVVHVPNAQLSVMSLENLAARNQIRFLHTLGLRRETTAEQLRNILHQSQQALSEHPMVEAGSARVRFTKVGDSSLDIEALAYIRETRFPVFLEIQELLLLRIMAIVESCGTRLALPSRLTYASDSGPTAAKDEQPESRDGQG